MEKKTKGFIGEFKEFISRGNVMDMAVGIIVGTAFTAIVTALVNGIIMPFVGFLIGGLNFEDYKLVLSAATESTPEVAILYGSFVQQIINFLIIAFVVFMMIKMLNGVKNRADALKKKEEEEKAAEEAAAPSEAEILLEIRDLLKAENKPAKTKTAAAAAEKDKKTEDKPAKEKATKEKSAKEKTTKEKATKTTKTAKTAKATKDKAKKDN